MEVSRVRKIVRKSSVWWKHGRHKSLTGIAAYFNREAEAQQKPRTFELLNLLCPKS